MVTLCFSPFCRRYPFLGILANIHGHTCGSGDGVPLSIGTQLGSKEGVPLTGMLRETEIFRGWNAEGSLSP
jgi:hypothetical protein